MSIEPMPNNIYELFVYVINLVVPNMCNLFVYVINLAMCDFYKD